MPKILPIDWQDFEKFLLYIGCVFKRQEGSHRVYSKDGLKRPIIVPARKSLPVFVVRNNLRTLGMTPDEYSEIRKRL